jgi:hypothetical protein
MAGFGEAIAQGIALGLGQGSQRYLDDQRKEKRDARKTAEAFKAAREEAIWQAEQTRIAGENMAKFTQDLQDKSAVKLARVNAGIAEEAADKDVGRTKTVNEHKSKLDTEGAVKVAEVKVKGDIEVVDHKLKAEEGSAEAEAEIARETHAANGVTDLKLKGIEAEKAKTAEWERVVKLPTVELAYALADQLTSGVDKKGKDEAMRKALKRLAGKTKVELLDIGGYTLGDYSEYVDDPLYKDAIPKHTVKGISDQDAASTFEYNVERDAETIAREKQTVYEQKKADVYQSITTMTKMKYSAIPDDNVKNLLWQGRPQGEGVVLQGAEAVSYDQTYLSNLIASGEVVQVGNKLRTAADIAEEDAIRAAREGFTKTATTTPQSTSGSVGSLYVEPKGQEIIDTKKEKEEKALRTKAVQRVEDKRGLAIKSYSVLGKLSNLVDGLSPDAKEILFGAKSMKGLLAMSSTAQQIAAKNDVKGAKEAREFLALMENISAELKHEQYGSAQTISELKTFANQLGNPSVFQNPDTLKAQIDTRKLLVKAGLEAYVGAEDRAYYLEAHPEAAELFGTKETVSDSSSKEGKEDITPLVLQAPVEYRDSIIKAYAKGKSVEQIKAYIAYLQNQ